MRMGGETESALVDAPRFSTNGPARQEQHEMRWKGKERCTLISFSQNSGIDKSAFHGLELGFASLWKSAGGVANTWSRPYREQITDVILQMQSQ